MRLCKKKLHAVNPDTKIEALSRLSEDLLCRETKKADIVLDCSDNFTTRYLVNRTSVSTGTALISATVTGFSGQICLFAPL